MKKVGIITYHHYNNYGTMLQALALQNMIENLGYDCEIIDFKQNNQLKKTELLKVRIKRIGIYFKNIKKYCMLNKAKGKFNERNKKFEEFYSKHLVLGNAHYTNSNEICANPPIYDAYIVGSDQTWNPNVGKNPDAFYLTFVKDKKQCGSYAPSVGLSKLTSSQETRMKSKLEHISYLSCREYMGSKLLHEVTEREVTTVLDPTMLLDCNKWIRYKDNMNRLPDNYILQYFLGDVIECRKFVKELSEKTNLPVLILPHSYLDLDKSNQLYCGPDGFLDLIYNADYICTDSFHGTAFSINFNKNFFAFHKRREDEDGSDNSRITDLLQRFGLGDRLITDYNLPDKLLIDYQRVNLQFDILRENSVTYLKNMLGELMYND